MGTLIKEVRLIDPLAKIDDVTDVYLDHGRVDLCPSGINPKLILDGKKKLLLPGLIDLHVHFRDPGFFNKEDISSGIKAAIAGGVTSALVMPNTDPPIDELKHVDYQLRRGTKNGFDLMVAAAASRGLLGKCVSDIGNLKRAGIKAVTDDGKPILAKDLMARILKLCRLHGLVCMQHAEDLTISRHASLNEGMISKKHKLAGQPCASEYSLVARDIQLAEEVQARYHVLHLSCSETLRLVKRAKRQSNLITCEVTPHHLLLNEFDVGELDTLKKMNPPLRTFKDTQALIDGLNDGSIDAVASDHAPHSCKEKRRPFTLAPFGVVGVESSIKVLLTLVKKGKLSLHRAIESMTVGPAKVIGESHRIGSLLGKSMEKNAVLIDPDFKGIFSRKDLRGRSKNSAFLGMTLYGSVCATFINGHIAFLQE